MFGFMFSGIFWGCVLILIGVLVIIKVVFHVNIDVVRLVFALIFIAIGIQILVGGFGSGMSKKEGCNVAFNDFNLKFDPAKKDQDYSIVFGKGTLDISELSLAEGNKSVHFHTAFGEGVLMISKSIPLKIRASSAFGDVKMPDGSHVAFGNDVYKSDNTANGSNYLDIDVSVAFGAIQIELK